MKLFKNEFYQIKELAVIFCIKTLLKGSNLSSNNLKQKEWKCK